LNRLFLGVTLNVSAIIPALSGAFLNVFSTPFPESIFCFPAPIYPPPFYTLTPVLSMPATIGKPLTSPLGVFSCWFNGYTRPGSLADEAMPPLLFFRDSSCLLGKLFWRII
jgi:hypothetical protein